MPKPKKGARLGGSASHQKKILANLAAQLIEHHAIKTTDAKAKMLRPYVEKIITKAKSGTVADRRNVRKLIDNPDVVYTLFNELAPQFADRQGGYTRIVKLENRKGDNAPMSQISLVLEPVIAAEVDRDARVAAQKEAEATKSAAEEAPADDADNAAEAEADAAEDTDAAAAEADADKEEK